MEWSRYQTNFKFFLLSNCVTDPKVKGATLLANIGMEALAYVKDLNAQTALDDDGVTLQILIEQLRNHFGKKTTVLTSRIEFVAIRQNKSQTVEEFAADIRAAATYCKFQEAYLDIRLRDQFVAGIKGRRNPKTAHEAKRQLPRRAKAGSRLGAHRSRELTRRPQRVICLEDSVKR